MALDTLSTNFVDFINYTFLVFSVLLLTTGMFLSYPFVRGEIEDEEKNEREAKVFAVGLGIFSHRLDRWFNNQILGK